MISGEGEIDPGSDSRKAKSLTYGLHIDQNRPLGDTFRKARVSRHKVNVRIVNEHDSAPSWMFENLLNIGSGDQVPGWISRCSNVNYFNRRIC